MKYLVSERTTYGRERLGTPVLPRNEKEREHLMSIGFVETDKKPEQVKLQQPVKTPGVKSK